MKSRDAKPRTYSRVAKVAGLPGDIHLDLAIFILPTDQDMRFFPEDDVVLEVPSMDEGLKVYRAKVGKVRRFGQICYLRNISCIQNLERRGAQRFPLHTKVEYCELKDEETGETLREGTVLNLSKTRLYLAADAPMKMGSIIVMMFEINWEDIEVPVGVMGTIVRERREEVCPGNYQYCYGVKFNSPRMVA